ncbi:ph domain [Cyclospora cayetanensis]|uniref:Ph domain n=1 Tax=Cyclospora cayetanensis TaxID=88456 RepID=A0A1D3D6Q6_9EIME|nr:ph domain [Cyclospora cayetanensis]
MGVLPDNAVSTQYWPECFSQRLDSQLRLTEGCSLGEELMVDFCLYTPEAAQQEEARREAQRQKRHKKKKPKPKQTPAELPLMVSTLVGARAARQKDAAKGRMSSGRSGSTGLPVLTPDTASPTAVGTPRDSQPQSAADGETARRFFTENESGSLKESLGMAAALSVNSQGARVEHH